MAAGLSRSQANKQAKKAMSFQTVFEALMYGLVNSIVAAPCLFGYALIIYRAPVFHDQLPALSKLVLFSSVVHQLVFTLMSSLSFSIGQVGIGTQYIYLNK
jgi:SulP family sulfate permease